MDVAGFHRKWAMAADTLETETAVSLNIEIHSHSRCPVWGT